MKVTVERAQLLKSLGHVHRVVERRNTIPILGNVLVRAENARLSLKATDLDLEVTETLAAETATGGSTTVPAHMFYDIVRKLPDGAQIVLEADGDRAVLAIRAGRSRFTLQTLPESDFPDLAAGDMTHSFALPAIISTASICTPPAPPRPRRFGAWRPTAIGWRRSIWRCPPAPPACPA